MSFQSLVTVIGQSDERQLAALKEAHTGFSDLFSSARTLGDEDSKPAMNGSDRMPAMLDLANVGTASLTARLDSLIKSVQAKMRTASRVKLFGALAATTSGGANA